MAAEYLVDIIAGARPNFMKIAPIIRAFETRRAAGGALRFRLIHTGQHYDPRMSGEFFRQLGIPEPDVNLEVGSGTQAEQTGAIMSRYEALLLEKPSNLCLVVGDVTSTMACAIAAQKLRIPVAHVEAGIRSGDWTMPEEINRMVTDSITNWFFTTSEVANENLRRTGVSDDRIFFVGNTMIDTLVAFEMQVQASPVLKELGLGSRGHVLMTIHRPATVDVPERLSELLDLIADVCASGRKVVFPIHPRTVKNIAAFGLKAKADAIKGLVLTEPLDYFAFQKLIATCAFILTDSGGIQEESTYRRVPCLTLRPNTERPSTVTIGSNELVPLDMRAVREAIARIENGSFRKGEVPPLWDGHATERIIEVLERVL